MNKEKQDNVDLILKLEIKIPLLRSTYKWSILKLIWELGSHFSFLMFLVESQDRA